ncbi:MAG: FAD binding domain-containing protein [Sandaracinaceae bacterium]|nr:FAD binding domain-containing protein [Sandaracinaceae bacterium]
MLRMPRFALESPETLDDAVALAARGARLVAGGTDLLPNLKHHLERPERLVSLHRLAALRAIALDGDTLRVGCGATLTEIAADPRVRADFPSLAEAAGAVAGPQIRNRATLGGNLHLDTRCRYVNQTELWRSAIGGCLKSEGTVCHVVPKGQNCVAALSSDTVPVLIALDATLVLAGPSGRREVELAKYFTADGLAHTLRQPGEIATEVRVPRPRGPRACAYVKWRPRASIDFPLVSVALRFDLDDERRVTLARVVAGVLGSKPREVEVPATVAGKRLGEVAALVADAAYAKCKPLANVPYDPAYRRHLVRVLTRRAIERLATEPAPGGP